MEHLIPAADIDQGQGQGEVPAFFSLDMQACPTKNTSEEQRIVQDVPRFFVHYLSLSPEGIAVLYFEGMLPAGCGWRAIIPA